MGISFVDFHLLDDLGSVAGGEPREEEVIGDDSLDFVGVAGGDGLVFEEDIFEDFSGVGEDGDNLFPLFPYFAYAPHEGALFGSGLLASHRKLNRNYFLPLIIYPSLIISFIYPHSTQPSFHP